VVGCSHRSIRSRIHLARGDIHTRVWLRKSAGVCAPRGRNINRKLEQGSAFVACVAIDYLRRRTSGTGLQEDLIRFVDQVVLVARKVKQHLDRMTVRIGQAATRAVRLSLDIQREVVSIGEAIALCESGDCAHKHNTNQRNRSHPVLLYFYWIKYWY